MNGTEALLSNYPSYQQIVSFFLDFFLEETLCVLVTIDSKSRVDRWIDL